MNEIAAKDEKNMTWYTVYTSDSNNQKAPQVEFCFLSEFYALKIK